MNKKLLSFVSSTLLISLCGCSNSSLLPSGDLPTFSVSLKNNKTHLIMSEKSNFANTNEKFEIPGTMSFELYTFTSIDMRGKIDSEETNYQYGLVQDNTYRFLKHTFFIKNEGPTTVDYTLTINLTENKKASDGRGLDTIARVALFGNDASSDSQVYSVYAKKSETPNQTYDCEEGETTFKEPISFASPERAKTQGKEFPGFAEMFESDSVITTHLYKGMIKDDIMRYTIVIWLEGEDQQAVSNPPQGTSLKFSVNIVSNESD